MTAVPEFDRLADRVVTWQGYNPEVRCDCGSTAVLTSGGWIVFDPIPLAESAWNELLLQGPLQSIVLTSGNHQRESLTLQKATGARIHAPASARGEVVADCWHDEGSDIAGFALTSVPGGGPGESAWSDGETLVIGDALIHLDGLTILPDKYCTDPRLLRKSLRGLLDLSFERITFAHGSPLTSNAQSILRSALE